jgi:hypothetical protein
MFLRTPVSDFSPCAQIALEDMMRYETQNYLTCEGVRDAADHARHLGDHTAAAELGAFAGRMQAGDMVTAIEAAAGKAHQRVP